MSNQSAYEPSEGEQSVDHEDFHHVREQLALALDWRRGLWAVLDVEMTGLETHDKIVEIAIVMMREGRVEEAWSSLVNPGMPIPAEATAIHGITDEMVANAPTLAELRVEVLIRIRKAAALVGYNIYRADQGWLERELPGVIGPIPVIDAIVVVRSEHVGKWWKGDYEKPVECPICDEDKPNHCAPARKGAGRHRLSKVAERLDCTGPEEGFEDRAHRAGWDAVMTGRIMWRACVRWCGSDAKTTETKLRAEGVRQEAELQSFRARMAAEEEAARTRRKESLALRVRDLEVEKESLVKRLDEVETYAAKLEAKLGQPPFAGGVS